jgi:hypothetical protein
MNNQAIIISILLCLLSINSFAYSNSESVEIKAQNSQIAIDTKNMRYRNESNTFILDTIQIALAKMETKGQLNLSQKTISKYQKQQKKGFILYFGSVIGMAIVAGLEVNPIGFVFIIPTVYANILIVKSNKHLPKVNTTYKNDSLE